MVSVLLAALLAAASTSATARAAPGLDLHCFQLMAELAEDEDPRLRSTFMVAAQYFLGRLDAAAPGTEVGSLPPLPAEGRDALLGRCGEAMQAGGRDFRAIGEALTPRSRPAA